MMPPRAAHSPHCRACKLRIREILIALHGDCLVNHAFAWPSGARPYAGTQVGDTLERIFDALCRYRGYENFVRATEMPPCDYYVPRAGFILELDEDQHFTQPRLVTLQCYAADLRVGFDLREWMRLCERLNSEDRTPPDRDERRAWYDCLLALLPLYHGFQPTVRLYSGNSPWCTLRPDSPEDRFRFASLLAG